MKIDSIDHGTSFDWGRTSGDYAKYRDIYPAAFYDKILSKDVGLQGQKILDIGTGTGVLPRNMYKYGAEWTGIDASENQIEQAKIIAENSGMKIEFYHCPAENIDFPDESFDAVTACQCIWYPDHKILAPKLAKILKPKGKFLILYMAWLPFEDEIAGKSEEIILKYNSDWTGSGEIRKHVWVPDDYSKFFEITYQEEFDVMVPFTRESWHGRMRACRGVGASMSENVLSEWNTEHKNMLENCPAEFDILHYVSIAELTLK